MSEVQTKAKHAKEISKFLNGISTKQKNEGLQAIAAALIANSDYLISENIKDVLLGEKKAMSKSILDRLTLNESRIQAMAEGIQILVSLPDPIGETMEGWKRPNGLDIVKKRVPIGVIGIIYEARPNVTVDVAGLTLKSSNAVILRGSSSAANSNIAIVKVINEALLSVGYPKNVISLIEETDRKTVQELVTCNGYVDLVIPRGGADLIKTVVSTASVPCIETGLGNCHLYIDKFANEDIIIPLVLNCKVQKPSVCNAIESLLIHKDIAPKVLPKILQALKEHKVELIGCEETKTYDPLVKLASDEDYATEFLDYKISIKVVEDISQAITHISRFGTKHTEGIISEDYTAIETFKTQVDASTIMVNASTRFTDGFEFGFGAEMGISTQKTHARGPMGLNELTIYKYIVSGNGQIRS